MIAAGIMWISQWLTRITHGARDSDVILQSKAAQNSCKRGTEETLGVCKNIHAFEMHNFFDIFHVLNPSCCKIFLYS